MNKLAYTLFLFFALSAGRLTYAQDQAHKKIMLILGSAEITSLQHRVAVGFQLYQSKPFDRVIVSGGCGAHGSSLCEASEMKRLLIAKGVPENIVFKEERSKTTIQNYVYSRALEDEDGQRIIQPGDTVYVVSDHWHAISVAARLNRYDQVKAFFHIEGNLQPREADKVDYASILYSDADNERFVRNALWPTVDATFRKDNTLYVLIDELVFTKTREGQETVQPLKELFPSVATFRTLRKIDAVLNQDGDQTLWLTERDSVFRLSLSFKRKTNITSMPLKQWIKNLPANWQKVDALFMMNDSLYAFHDDELLVAVPKGKFYVAVDSAKIKQKITNFPFNWAGGYIDAADFDPATHTVTLFKAKEQLTLDENLNVVGERAKPFTLTWPTAYYGERNGGN
ncbi:hypothetical protein GCM10023231_31500 [Olivibacter ginsenosidimutans]|uniref:DUF218 domain-containing protein n=1 Tax=Olivibacter ginsenosidimutans TaxID=1176537 RepID=A0ABP9BTP7_9SPHI